MKRLWKLAIMVSLLLCITIAVSAEINEQFSLLNDMSLSELEELESAVKSRISELKKINEARNADDTGMWVITNYVDNFGDFTDIKYIKNRFLFKGTFSNSATQGRELTVSF